MTTIPADPTLRSGDLILVELGPVLGTEQDGRRPAIVVSEAPVNAISRRVVICPITRNVEPWSTQVLLPAGLGATGAVMTDQIRAIDQCARILRRRGSVPDTVLVEGRYQIAKLLGL